MNLMIKGIAAFLGFTAASAFASPTYLITTNTTAYESNAYVAGVTPSPVPTKAHATGRVHWALVRMSCYNHIAGGRCPALIKMATNTPNPINVGMVTLDIETGDILPKTLSANGFTVTVTGPGTATITKD